MAAEYQGSTTPFDVWIATDDKGQEVPDQLATEEPLEIRLRSDSGERAVAVTMRTPGSDAELAAGFLFTEGIVTGRDDIAAIGPAMSAEGVVANVVVVHLRKGLEPDLPSLERNFYTTSSCGVCGKASMEALLVKHAPRIPEGPKVPLEILYELPARLATKQGVFQSTGGLHAAALFDPGGELLAAREDVGRHNAVDKLVGWGLREGRLPFHDRIVMVSGRTSFEIIQKCLVAAVPFVCAVSAPSSLAVGLAREFGMTLVGFLRGRRLNVYAGRQRIAQAT